MDATRELSFSTRRNGEQLVVGVRGELDLASVPRLVELVNKETAEHVPECVLDFYGVTFIDSEAVKALIILRRSLLADGTCLKIVNLRDLVVRILSLIDPTGQTGWEGCREPGQAI